MHEPVEKVCQRTFTKPGRRVTRSGFSRNRSNTIRIIVNQELMARSGPRMQVVVTRKLCPLLVRIQLGCLYRFEQGVHF